MLKSRKLPLVRLRERLMSRLQNTTVRKLSAKRLKLVKNSESRKRKSAKCSA